jgi:hypothetical protein
MVTSLFFDPEDGSIPLHRSGDSYLLCCKVSTSKEMTQFMVTTVRTSNPIYIPQISVCVHVEICFYCEVWGSLGGIKIMVWWEMTQYSLVDSYQRLARPMQDSRWEPVQGISSKLLSPHSFRKWLREISMGSFGRSHPSCPWHWDGDQSQSPPPSDDTVNVNIFSMRCRYSEGECGHTHTQTHMSGTQGGICRRHSLTLVSNKRPVCPM